MTHEDRLLRSDVDAIARDRAEVEARLRAQRNNPDDMRLWARAGLPVATEQERTISPLGAPVLVCQGPARIPAGGQ